MEKIDIEKLDKIQKELWILCKKYTENTAISGLLWGATEIISGIQIAVMELPF